MWNGIATEPSGTGLYDHEEVFTGLISNQPLLDGHNHFKSPSNYIRTALRLLADGT